MARGRDPLVPRPRVAGQTRRYVARQRRNDPALLALAAGAVSRSEGVAEVVPIREAATT